MKKIKDLEWGIEYDFDETTKRVFKNLKCFHNNGTTTQDRFEYEYIKERYSEPYESDAMSRKIKK